ncbi:MAG: hypothetical protein JWQ35_469 [Bacteriovoracaceae bacterium]|nr:hypothetical protein [Bacteriovoracaceae bacterium]
MADENSQDPSPEKSANKFGRYTVVEPLAKGGMAQIYKARTATGKTFTLKKILKDYSENTEFIQMFLEEAKISLSLKHPNVIRVLDFGQLDGSYFLAMEYVFGRDVSALLKKCAESRLYIPLEVVCHIIYQCCLGLDYAHNQRDSFGTPLGIIHRDISPPNILVSYNGDVKILDFGIAKALSSSKSREETRSGILKGKFSYMSPEQASGKPLEAQSDIFSLGTVFYELLTTRNLFYVPDEIETLERVRKAQVQPPSRVRKDIPAELEKIVMKSLSLKPKNRFQSCAEMSEAILKFLHNYYPRSDTRSVAKFLRGVFSVDFQNRFQPSISDGWQDVLEVGGADDSLMLDVRESRADYRSVRTGQQPIQWHQRVLYDPKTTAILKSNLLKMSGIAAVLILLFTFFMIYRSGSFDSFFSSNTSDAPAEVELPVDRANEKQLQNPKGSFADLVDQASKAEDKGDFETALRLYNRALEINAFETSVQARKNFMLIALGNFDDACPWFQQKSELPSEDKILSTAICEEASGDIPRAMAAYSDFLSKFPEERRVDRVRSVITSLKKKWKR